MKNINKININIIHDLAYYLEIDSYLKNYEIYNNYDDFQQKATCCDMIYNKFIDEAIKHDLYIIPDYFHDKKEEIENILKSIEGK